MHKFNLGDVLTLKAAVEGAGDTEGRCLPKFHVLSRVTFEDANGFSRAYRGRLTRADDVVEQAYRDMLEEELVELPEDYAEEDHRPTHYTVMTPEQFRDRVKATTNIG